MNINHRLRFSCFIIFICLFLLLIAASLLSVSHARNDSPQTHSDSSTTISVTHGDKGWEFRTTNGDYVLQFQSRLQFRYAYPCDSDPTSYDDFDRTTQHLFKINRARLKIGGNAFKPWLKYYWEYELAAGNLLDFRVMVARFSYLKIKVGQWKVQYNRERMISSGKQQMADRSLINRVFTVDRQQGISLYGHWKPDGIADFNYWASIFSGTGRGAKSNDDEHPMFMVRGQWNFLGRELKFAGSDTKFHKKAAGLLAVGAVTNRSPYTRFSQDGGGQLEGFDEGDPGQYRVNQWMEETALMMRGFSWQQEFHWKRIKDFKNMQTTTLLGNYLQFGYFVHYWQEWFPKPLELALRHAFYNPDTRLSEIERQEYSLVLNWFFKGHQNKLTAELSYFDFDESARDEKDGFRFRLQWDISL